jgi:hypothetical protein
MKLTDVVNDNQGLLEKLKNISLFYLHNNVCGLYYILPYLKSIFYNNYKPYLLFNQAKKFNLIVPKCPTFARGGYIPDWRHPNTWGRFLQGGLNDYCQTCN